MSLFSRLPPRLLRASWRGVPFAVTGSDGRYGRRAATHEYPGRDTPWTEDLGRKARGFALTGFLVSNSSVYGGGDVRGQADRMIRAAEAAGAGVLVHPTRGVLQLVCLELTVHEPLEAATYLEITLTLVEAGQQQFPSAIGATGAAVASGASGANGASALDFAAAALGALKSGAAAVEDALATATAWTAQIDQIARDPTSLVGLSSLLGGPFGRYFGGVASALTSVSDLVDQASSLRAALAATSTDVVQTIGGLGATTTPATLAAAAQAQVAALAACCAAPGDRVRLLAQLAGYTPTGTGAGGTIGPAVSDLFRRAAAVELASASAVYAPTSYDDAAAVRDLVAGVLAAVAETAGDQGEDATYAAMRALRASVVADFRARGANLAPLRRVTIGAALPALVLAQRLYQDPARADELVARAAPTHPLFMPPTFEALAA